MEKIIFDVLSERFESLKKLGYEIEKNIFTNPNFAIINSCMFIEEIFKKVCELEEENYLIQLNQYDRIRLLYKEGIIDKDIVGAFDQVRTTGNKAVNEEINNDIEAALMIHKKLYIILKWFVESYESDYSVQVAVYIPPKLQETQLTSSLEDIMQKRIKEYIDFSNKKVLAKQKGIVRDLSKTEEEINEEKSIYMYQKLKGSYLLNEISKLSSFSQEAVESSDSLDTFKKYLHVERTIQNELINILEEANTSDSAELVLLGGSVGDGKSHLLGFINKEYIHIISNFNIHNDATESFDPSLTEIETLESVLNPFNDENIDSSNSKLILAINLGVLNNFLEEDFAKKNYTKLINFISKSEVFNQDVISKSYREKNYKLVSFGDYNIYELTEKGPKSSYIESLFKKIVDKNQQNPFYIAYLKDKEESCKSPVILNYEILSMNGVINRITQLIIETLVKSKILPGTREILNFIYEIMVPSNIDDFDLSSMSLDYIDSLMPNILFSSRERGVLLKSTSNEDPLKIRHEKLDELIIRLNISDSLESVLVDYMENEQIEMLKSILGGIENINLISDTYKQDIIETLIRFMYLSGKDNIIKTFEDKAYINYMKYLYYYNTGNLREYKKLFDETKDAVFNWNGSPKSNYIYLDEKYEKFKVAEQLKIKRSTKKGVNEKRDEESIERFKINIMLGFEVPENDLVETIELDYQLYKKIVDVNEGYCPGKKDKEEAVIFVEFIENFIVHGDMEKELIIESKLDNKKFLLKYYDDGFGDEFIFERIED